MLVASAIGVSTVKVNVISTLYGKKSINEINGRKKALASGSVLNEIVWLIESEGSKTLEKGRRDTSSLNVFAKNN